MRVVEINAYLFNSTKSLFRRAFLICYIISQILNPAIAQNNALVLNGAFVMLNGGAQTNPIYLVVNQSSTSGIIVTASGGHIQSENQYNYVLWNAAGGKGNYVFPFGVGGNAADYIPFTFNKTTAANSNIGVSTWATNPQNMPHPDLSNVAAVSNMLGTADSVNKAIDRFWDIQSPSDTADLTFSYRGIENTTAIPTDTFNAQLWNGTTWEPQAGPGNPGVKIGIGTVGPIPGQTAFSPSVLTRVELGTTIISSQNLICNSQCTGTASATSRGGTPPYTYLWNPSANNTSTASSLCAGTYFVVVTDAAGTTAIDTVNILQPLNLTSSMSSTSANCGSNDGSATATVSGGTGSFIYTWSQSGQTTATSTGLSAGSYTVTVTDANHCSISSLVNVSSTGGTAVSGTISAVHDTVCEGTTGYLVLDSSLGTPVQWQSASVTGNFYSISGDTSTNYVTDPMLQTTRYRVIVGTGGCADTSKVFALTVMPTPVAVFSYTSNGKQVTFNSMGTSADVNIYSWDFDDGSKSSAPHPIHEYTTRGTFNVCLTVYNGSNCSYTLCQYVYIDSTTSIGDISAVENFIIYPNPFGNNIFIEDKGSNKSVEHIEIYNVLGQMLLDKEIVLTNQHIIQLDVSNLTNGVYELRIKTEGRGYTQKIIKLNR